MCDLIPFFVWMSFGAASAFGMQAKARWWPALMFAGPLSLIAAVCYVATCDDP